MEAGTGTRGSWRWRVSVVPTVRGWGWEVWESVVMEKGKRWVETF